MLITAFAYYFFLWSLIFSTRSFPRYREVIAVPLATMARLLALAWGGFMLLAPAAHAQSNMCYPTPGKRSPLKKGPCFMVSHTLPEYLGIDMVNI